MIKITPDDYNKKTSYWSNRSGFFSDASELTTQGKIDASTITPIFKKLSESIHEESGLVCVMDGKPGVVIEMDYVYDDSKFIHIDEAAQFWAKHLDSGYIADTSFESITLYLEDELAHLDELEKFGISPMITWGSAVPNERIGVCIFVPEPYCTKEMMKEIYNFIHFENYPHTIPDRHAALEAMDIIEEKVIDKHEEIYSL